MEDILASIRRILNEDEGSPPSQALAPDPPAAAAAPLESSPAVEDGVLVLDEAMLVVAPAMQPAGGAVPAPAMAPPPVPATLEHVAEPAPLAAPVPGPMPALIPASAPMPAPIPSEALLAPDSAAAAAASVGSLLRTLSSSRGTQVHRGGPTIEDLVRDELRVLLKVWLDEHLPPMVERLVRQEIERVTGHVAP